MGNKPDYEGDGISVWINKSKEGKVYCTVQLFGPKGVRVNCFPPDAGFVTEYDAKYQQKYADRR
jgi:hypothetical protein